jgi:hypothetical protein
MLTGRVLDHLRQELHTVPGPERPDEADCRGDWQVEFRPPPGRLAISQFRQVLDVGTDRVYQDPLGRHADCRDLLRERAREHHDQGCRAQIVALEPRRERRTRERPPTPVLGDPHI